VEQLFERWGAQFTADEAASELGESILAIRPRLSELVALGKIEDSGLRRKNASGMTATVWRRKEQFGQRQLL
jgi:predicted ArsR family transcriptional regulator